MSHRSTIWWICLALFRSSIRLAPSCPRNLLRIIFVLTPLLLCLNKLIPCWSLSCFTNGHSNITWASPSCSVVPSCSHHGQFFHCFPNLFFILFPNIKFPDLAMHRILLSLESSTCLCSVNHSPGCGWAWRDLCSCFSSNTNRTAASLIACLSCFKLRFGILSSMSVSIYSISFIQSSWSPWFWSSAMHPSRISSCFLFTSFQ